MAGTKYRPWFVRFKDRFEQEVDEMVARGFILNDEALRNEQRVEFRGRSKVDPNRVLIVQYPDAFPSMPSRVFLQSGAAPLGRHFNPNTSEVCLFGPGQLRWASSVSGAQAIDEAENIIRLFAQPQAGIADDLVPEPISATFSYEQDAAFLIPPGLEVLDVGSGDAIIRGQLRFRFEARGYSGIQSAFPGRGIVLDARWKGEVRRAGAFFQQTYVTRGQEMVAPLIYVPEPPPFIRSISDLQNWLTGLGVTREKWMAWIFPEESGTAYRKRLAWLTVNSTPHQVHLIRTFTIRADERGVRIPGMAGLSGKNVVVIGCGSLGSKIAVSLAATGVERFVLIDPDFIEPHNAVRHEVGVDGFGTQKVTAVLNRIFSINPFATDRDKWAGLGTVIGGVNTYQQEENLWNKIAEADIVIETTGIHGVSRFVNDVCFELGIPALIVSVTNGAWAGEIVRIIPGETACWQCWVEEFQEAPPGASVGPEGVFAPGCDQPSFTGTGYEAGIVANIGAWVAVETLLRSEKSRKDFTGDYIRWIGKNSGGEPVLTSEVLVVSRRSHCHFCNP